MKKKSSFTRRNFLKTGLANSMAVPLIGHRAYGLDNVQDEIKIKEYRTLGRTGFKVSDISMGARLKFES